MLHCVSLLAMRLPVVAEEYVFKLLAFPVLLLVVVTGSFILQYVPQLSSELAGI